MNRAAHARAEAPRLWRGHGQVRQDEGGLAEVAVFQLQGDVDWKDRRRGEAAGGLPGMAAVGEAAGRHARRGAHLQAQARQVLGGLARSPGNRRGAPRRVRRRHPPRAQRRGAHSHRGGLRHRLAHGALGKLAVPGRAHGQDAAARGGGDRRRQRVRGGQEGELAGYARPECVFHAFNQVKRRTTTRPKLQAGVEPHGLAEDPLRVEDAGRATAWLQVCNGRCARWEAFLAERTLDEETGRMGWTHGRLVTARNGLNALIRCGRPFAFLDPGLTAEGPPPSTNNKLEGGVNAQLRDMLRKHRGLSLMRRAKAVFWWCCMHAECPLGAAEILRVMPTDDDIVEPYRQTVYEPQKRDGPTEWGDGLVWAELRHVLPWRIEWE